MYNLRNSFSVNSFPSASVVSISKFGFSIRGKNNNLFFSSSGCITIFVYPSPIAVTVPIIGNLGDNLFELLNVPNSISIVISFLTIIRIRSYFTTTLNSSFIDFFSHCPKFFFSSCSNLFCSLNFNVHCFS